MKGGQVNGALIDLVWFLFVAFLLKNDEFSNSVISLTLMDCKFILQQWLLTLKCMVWFYCLVHWNTLLCWWEAMTGVPKIYIHILIWVYLIVPLAINIFVCLPDIIFCFSQNASGRDLERSYRWVKKVFGWNVSGLESVYS